MRPAKLSAGMTLQDEAMLFQGTHLDLSDHRLIGLNGFETTF